MSDGRWYDWYADARQAAVAEVAAALGLVVSRGGVGPTCPACGATRRGSSDRRPPIGLHPGGGGWACHACKETGDGVDLACLVLVGERRPPGERRDDVRAWFAAQGWCRPDERHQGPSTWTPPAPRRAPPAPAPAPARLDPGEVADLWSRARGVSTEPRCADWLRSRGIDPARVELADAARALVPGTPCPSWAGVGRRTWADDWPLLLPCYGPNGEIVALRARATDPSLGKDVSPRGPGATRGTVYADPVARWLLATGGGARRGDRPDPEAPSLCWNGWVVVVEGGPSWLWLAAHPSRFRHEAGVVWTPAFMGVWSGAWPDDPAGHALAARLPPGTRLVLSPDDDEDGDSYAEAITRSLANRPVKVTRVIPRGRTP